MRIIAGEFRGRRLLAPDSDTTRPITDRVKQSLFDILAPRIEEARVYDCFAGTGSMGLECLSRGAANATFFEMDRSAIGRLRKNITALDVASQSAIVTQDLFTYFRSKKNLAGKVELVFLDPPYRFLRERAKDLLYLARGIASHLAPDAIVVFRHDAGDRLELPPLARYDEREYGGMMIEFLQLA